MIKRGKKQKIKINRGKAKGTGCSVSEWPSQRSATLSGLGHVRTCFSWVASSTAGLVVAGRQVTFSPTRPEEDFWLAFQVSNQLPVRALRVLLPEIDRPVDVSSHAWLSRRQLPLINRCFFSTRLVRACTT